MAKPKPNSTITLLVDDPEPNGLLAIADSPASIYTTRIVSPENLAETFGELLTVLDGDLALFDKQRMQELRRRVVEILKGNPANTARMIELVVAGINIGSLLPESKVAKFRRAIEEHKQKSDKARAARTARTETVKWRNEAALPADWKIVARDHGKLELVRRMKANDPKLPGERALTKWLTDVKGI
jgi:hypothetical protein